MEKLINQKGTAVFTCNNLMAIGALRQQGLSPKDISIIGYDDIPICDMLDYPLTTINQTLYDMGKKSFNLIFSHITDPSSMTENTMLVPSVVVRETTFKLENK